MWLAALLLCQEWEEVDIEATVRKDGAIEVHERRSAARRVALDRAGLDRIEVVQADGARVREEMRLTILEWDAAQRVELRYVVWGAATREGVEWRALSEFHESPVRRVRVLVKLPPGAGDVPAHLSSACARTELVRSVDAVEFRGWDLPARGSLSIRLRLPLDPPVMLRRELKTRYGSLLLFGIPGALVVFLLGLYLVRGRDPRVTSDAEGPDDQPPALSGLVLDEVAGAPEAAATVVDLLRRGAIRAEGRRLTLVGTDGLASWEKTAIEALFGSGRTADLDEPPPREAPRASALTDEIYAEGVRRGFFRRSPAAERRIWRIAGFAFAILGVGLALATAKFQEMYTAAFLILALPFFVIASSVQSEEPRRTLSILTAGLVLMAAALFILVPSLDRVGFTWLAKLAAGITLCAPICFGFAPALPVKTVRGAEAKHRAAAALRALDTATADEFEDRLAHAVAFRMKKPFVHRMAAIGAVTPSWWKPSGEPLSSHADALLGFLGALSARLGRETLMLGGG